MDCEAELGHPRKTASSKVHSSLILYCSAFCPGREPILYAPLVHLAILLSCVKAKYVCVGLSEDQAFQLTISTFLENIHIPGLLTSLC